MTGRRPVPAVPTGPVPVSPAPSPEDEALWAVAEPMMQPSSFGPRLPSKLRRALRSWADAKGLD